MQLARWRAVTPRHQFLHMVWSGYPDLFAVLSFSEQRALHRFCRPTEDLTDDQLGRHVAASPPGERAWNVTIRRAAGDPAQWRKLVQMQRFLVLGRAGRRHLQ